MPALTPEFLQQVSTISDTVSSVVAVLLLIVAVFGLKQINETKTARINQAKRDSLEYSDKIVDYFLKEILEMVTRYRDIRVSFGLKIENDKYLHYSAIFENKYSRSELDTFRKKFDSVSKMKGGEAFFEMQREILNKLEKLAFMVNTNLGDSEMVFNCIGAAYMNLVTEYKDMLRLNIAAKNSSGKYPNINSLYKSWFHKAKHLETLEQVTNHSKQIDELQLEMENMNAGQYKQLPIGTI